MVDREVTFTLRAPEGYDPIFFFTMLQSGASDAVRRAAMSVFEKEEAGEDSSFSRRHYEACKEYAAEVQRVMDEVRNRSVR